MGNTINESQKFITLDGLETFYNKLQSKYTTPNWDAQKGETGYIENRTHYKELALLTKPTSGLTTIKKPTNENISGEWEFYVDDWMFYPENYEDGFGSINNIEIIHQNNTYEVTELSYTDTGIRMKFKQTNLDFGNFSYIYDIVDNKVTLTCYGDTEFVPESIQYFRYHTLNEAYIPDTVVKTTPQTLSDADKKQALANLGIQEKIEKLVNINYLDLVNLRKNSQLIPGQQYRITDYVTTTTQSNTQSAGHQFDIIVVADDVNVLNENARAIQHEEDTYFLNSDLNAWELKYCLDNDTNRYAWADDSEDYTIHLPLSDSIRNLLQQSFGSNAYIPGVITFKYWNHKFNDPNCEEWIGIDYYAAINVKLPGDDRLLIAYPHGTKLYSNIAFSETLSTAFNNDIAGNCFFINGQPIPDLGPIDTLPTVLNEEKGKGVIYYMKDEFNNECPYDFKNIQFRHPKDTDTYPDYYYTFTWIDENYDIMDTSIFGNNGTLTCYGEIYGVYSNVIKPYMGMIYDEDSDEYLGTKQLLNSIIFISDYKYEGGNDGFFGCCGNSFGNDCSRNSFGNDCYRNSFGDGCHDNSFGNNCYRNSFGDGCSRNSFGDGCYDNSFGNNCYRNSFGDGCCDNSFGDGCYDNSFGDGCYDNSFGNNCSHNSFGNSCYSNSFGDGCYDNSFGNNCYGNSFGNNCSHNSFGESSSNPKSYYCYIIFDNGNSYINLNCTSTTSSSKYYQNVRIGLGVNNAYTTKTINDNNVNQKFETLYKPTNSQTLTV